jgi:hypothetical protein
MMEIVNGYVCMNWSDVALAKKNVDPSKPQNDPNSSGASSNTTSNPNTPAVTFAGTLTELNGAKAVQQADGSASSNTFRLDAGAQLDIQA